MISEREFLENIQGLNDKTAKDNRKWQAKPLTFVTSNGQLTVPAAAIRDAYWVQLPHSVIELQYGCPSAESDFINFTLARKLNGDVLASRKVYAGDIGWDRLNDLYALIKRRDLGWDEVFKDVRDFLGSPNIPAAS